MCMYIYVYIYIYIHKWSGTPESAEVLRESHVRRIPGQRSKSGSALRETKGGASPHSRSRVLRFPLHNRTLSKIHRFPSGYVCDVLTSGREPQSRFFEWQRDHTGADRALSRDDSSSQDGTFDGIFRAWRIYLDTGEGSAFQESPGVSSPRDQLTDERASARRPTPRPQAGLHALRAAPLRRPHREAGGLREPAPGSGVHKEGFSKKGFSKSNLMITHKLLNPPLLNPPL